MEEKIGGKRHGEVRNFKKVRKFASSNLKFRSSKFKFTEILICNPGTPTGWNYCTTKSRYPGGLGWTGRYPGGLAGPAGAAGFLHLSEEADGVGSYVC